MRRTLTALAACTALGLGGVALAQEGYDEAGGYNWFGDFDNESIGLDDSWAGDYDGDTFGGEGLYGDGTYGYDGVGDYGDYTLDEYGYFDNDYAWETDDQEFDNWYGDSDEWF